MASTISVDDYYQLWYDNNKNIQQSDPSDSSDVSYICPPQFGRGYERCIELRDISLMIIDEQFHDDLIFESKSEEMYVDETEIGFHLAGNYNCLDAGKNFIYSDGFYGTDTKVVALGQKRLLKVDIHFKPHILSSFITNRTEQIPPELKRLLEPNKQGNRNHQVDTTTAAMRLPLEQILNCPFHGLTKQIYLEGKCLELVALKLEQLAQSNHESTKSTLLKPDDIERIYQAKNILIQKLDNPPTLIQLARLVGLNDYKLKIGFHQVFGTTAFGYLYQQRMEKARLLVLEGKMSVKEIARATGYQNQSYFSVAFRKRFGVNPKSYRFNDESKIGG
ncbi:MAG: helix-turn-helix domain-containing protein [Brasilonema octagenarum HA4186-MV1]|jgi:AraC-like DNA-binding protein|uniref:AraC family transcriptional regulator n=2 Tax=Brasilonema TaxID=383614 RepID=A0A856MCB4_9CYAN|nr:MULTISPECIES: AraC family transcriptional regulator [Brasilonema]MBW4627429.1 helix-turn-helix domain-containing protein [Brasilonema octagenarum HA4186-MV1]NMF66272.1 AraC family transcriptional regulator [Brasilonema octagenarum UFV-OR1]QDL07960.1 AraC family transcriptional regulator [Brasilonema sennae CENA114]QDL14320.1 AraC family transcriptional regulator [Brasilonema octagenarum UFV-E1]